jgi:signal transduction histidine kinase
MDRAACDRAVHAFAVEEELLAAQVVEEGHPVVSVRTAGDTALARHPALLLDIPLIRAGQLARFASDSLGYTYYDIAVPGERGTTRGNADWFMLRYALAPTDPLFATGSQLGGEGESFLADPTGRPLSALRFRMPEDLHGVITAAPMRDCLAGHDAEVLEPDYRGAAIIHGYRFVPEIGGGCIMAHVSQLQATAPLLAIRDRLMMIGALLALLALLVSVVLARAITAPLTALVESAEAVARGEQPSPVPEEGVPEVRTLARAFSSMTAAIEHRTAEREFALAARARFYHAMSHELRTPLNAIVGYLDLLRGGIYGTLPDAAHSALVRSQRAAYLLRDLINDVLDLAKIEAGRIDIRPEPVNIAVLLGDLRATLEPVAAAAGTELRLECDDDLVVKTDPQRIGQILLNLVSNAIKFGQRAPVTINCRREDGGAVVIAVTDLGTGIAPEDQERIFEEYVQLQGGEHAGTGLGLAISRRLAQALGGSLTVESRLGHGSTFRLRLP